MPVPDLAVGRLVDTAAEAGHMLDAYTATNGVITPGSALVTGYDFVADAATSVAAELTAGINPAGCSGTTGSCYTPDELIAPQGVPSTDPSVWTAYQLSQKLLGSHHDVVFMAGHFSAGNLLAADYSTQLSAAEVVTSTANLTNTLVLALGCHSGLNIPGQDAMPGVSPSPDWPQAMAEKGATLLAATGYAYGDTVLTEYGERLFVDVCPAAAHGDRQCANRRGKRRGQATIPEYARRPWRHRREDPAGDDPVRPAHDAGGHAGSAPRSRRRPALSSAPR